MGKRLNLSIVLKNMWITVDNPHRKLAIHVEISKVMNKQVFHIAM